jgi:hypothetical protein
MNERLLKLAGPIHVIGGLLLFAAGFSPWALSHLQPLLIGNSDYVWSAYFVSILGPTIASWGVLFAALVNQFYETPSLRLWRSLVLAILVWAPLDTALSLRYGITLGAVVNTTIVFILGALLINARKILH